VPPKRPSRPRPRSLQTSRPKCRQSPAPRRWSHCASGRWNKADPVILQIDNEPPQALIADPDAPDADSFKNKDYEFYALKTFITLTRKSHGVVVKTYNACRAE
jgi:hypothetical protein